MLMVRGIAHVDSYALARALIRLQTPHLYFDEVRFSYEVVLNAKEFHTAIQGTEKARHVPTSSEPGAFDLRARIEWKPKVSLVYELNSGNATPVTRIMTPREERTLHGDREVQKTRCREWLGRSEPSTLEGMFFESRVNHAAINACVGSEVVWPRYFFLGEVQPKSVQEYLGRKTVRFEISQTPRDVERLRTPPDVEDIFYFCDRFLMQIDVATGLMLHNVGYLGTSKVFCSRVSDLWLG